MSHVHGDQTQQLENIRDERDRMGASASRPSGVSRGLFARWLFRCGPTQTDRMVPCK